MNWTHRKEEVINMWRTILKKYKSYTQSKKTRGTKE